MFGSDSRYATCSTIFGTLARSSATAIDVPLAHDGDARDIAILKTDDTPFNAVCTAIAVWFTSFSMTKMPSRFFLTTTSYEPAWRPLLHVAEGRSAILTLFPYTHKSRMRLIRVNTVDPFARKSSRGNVPNR